MKQIALFLAINFLAITYTFAQTSPDVTTLYEWNVSTTGTTALGERVIAYINSGTIGPYTGGSVVGQVIDGNGNWGYQVPTVANFKASVNFSNSVYQLQQDVATTNITLELKSISATQVALVANCPLSNKQMRVFFRLTTTNGATVTMGSSSTILTGGTMLIAQPTYTNQLSGNLAINVTNASVPAGYALAVGGKAIAESVTVKLQSSWPDYVFKTSYHLPSLNDVQTYINQNHHLPEMPSEQQIATDGLNLGDMDRLLTKKVEELTLYLIEKDKQLNVQQNQINAQGTNNVQLSDQIKTQQEQLKFQQEQIAILIKQVAKISNDKNK